MIMIPYNNSAGNSGVIAYDIGKDRITIKFIGGDTYVYSYASAGKRMTEQMKTLARNGKGLSTFISQTARDKYERVK